MPHWKIIDLVVWTNVQKQSDGWQLTPWCKIRTITSSASKLMKLAMANPSMMSSSQDTDSLFLRRGGLCLPKPGRHSLPPGPRTLLVPQASWSEPEDRDVALSSARSTLLLRRSLSRCDRDRRLCLNPVLRLGPSMFTLGFVTPVRPKALYSSPGPVEGTEPQKTPPHRPSQEASVKMALLEAGAYLPSFDNSLLASAPFFRRNFSVISIKLRSTWEFKSSTTYINVRT